MSGWIEAFPVGTRIEFTEDHHAEHPMDFRLPKGTVGTVTVCESDEKHDRYVMVRIESMSVPDLDEWDNDLQLWCHDDVPDEPPAIRIIGRVPVRYVVRDIATKGANHLLWGDDEPEKAARSLKEAQDLFGAYEVELVTMPSTAMEPFTASLILGAEMEDGMNRLRIR